MFARFPSLNNSSFMKFSDMNTSKFFVVFFVSFLVFISSANAHMEIVSPLSRGHDEDKMSTAPCGGFDNVKTTSIAEFPITKGQATTSFEDGNGKLVYNYAPNSTGNFTLVSDTVPITVSSNSNITTPVDLSKAGVKVGDQGVLQAIYVATDTTWYQCADIKVVDAKTKTNGVTSFFDVSEVTYFIIAFVSFFMVLN